MLPRSFPMSLQRALWITAGCIALTATATAQGAASVEVTLDGNAPRVDVSPSLYGIFLEEINHSGEGGIYAEMVQNRDFENTNIPAGARWAGNLIRTQDDWQERKGFGNQLWPWRMVEQGAARGQIHLTAEHPLHASNPHSMQVTVSVPGDGIGVVNDGFWGMHFVAGAKYDLSFYARTESGTSMDLSTALESASGHEQYAVEHVTVSGEWKQYHITLAPAQNDNNGRLRIAFTQPGTVWFDVVSLFPRDTYKGRPNGLRPDLVQTLAALHPSIMRFPGGAVSGGLNLDDRFQWKHSIGDIAARQGMFDLWGYYSTNGLGFHEYLQLIEDLGGSALYVCNPGFSDNYRHAEYAKPDQIPAFVQDALDALEYALGPVTSYWGAQRAASGHPAPFRLSYVEIGNETSGNIYPSNYKQFYQAIKARYPQLTLIAADAVTGQPVDMVDRHEFGASAKLYEDWRIFDKDSRTGPKYYVGEYSVDRGSGEGDLESALAEAAFMLGLERNSDVVRISSYAPLLSNVNDNAWPVNMIHFDSYRIAPRTSYYVQKLFAENRPTQTLGTSISPAPETQPDGVYALGGWDQASRQIVVKVVNRASADRQLTLTLVHLPAMAGEAHVQLLANVNPSAENTVDDPSVVVPEQQSVAIHGTSFHAVLKANSLTVYRLDTAADR